MAGLLGDWFQPTGSTNNSNVLGAFGSSGLGQGMADALASYEANARAAADFDMDMKKKELDLRVQQLRQQGRTAEANAEYQKGQLELAKQRLAWEKEIETKKFNLSRAETLAKFNSGPDMMFMRTDVLNALARAGLGAGPAPLSAAGAPRMRTVQDFNAAENGTWNGTNSGPSVGGPGAYPTLTRSLPADAGGGGASSSGGGTANQADPRLTAATAVMKAIQPSETGGTDENDMAALAAIENIYRAAKPGTLQRMRPGQREAFSAGLSRLGFYAPDAVADMQRAGIGQGNARRAA